MYKRQPTLVIDVALKASLPISVATVKPLLKLALLPSLTVSALKVESLLAKITLDVLAVVKLTVAALLLFAADIPSTVIFPVELLPIFNVPAVILPSSAPEIVIPPAVPPNPIVPPSETAIVVELVPLLIDPDKVISLAVKVRALIPVDSVVDELFEKFPAPLPSESAVITVAPAVVKFSARDILPVEVNVNAPAPIMSPDVVDIVRSPPAVNVTPGPKSIPVAPASVKAPALVIDVALKASLPVSVATVKPLPKLVLLPSLTAVSYTHLTLPTILLV